MVWIKSRWCVHWHYLCGLSSPPWRLQGAAVVWRRGQRTGRRNRGHNSVVSVFSCTSAASKHQEKTKTEKRWWTCGCRTWEPSQCGMKSITGTLETLKWYFGPMCKNILLCMFLLIDMSKALPSVPLSFSEPFRFFFGSMMKQSLMLLWGSCHRTQGDTKLMFYFLLWALMMHNTIPTFSVSPVEITALSDGELRVAVDVLLWSSVWTSCTALIFRV